MKAAHHLIVQREGPPLTRGQRQERDDSQHGRDRRRQGSVDQQKGISDREGVRPARGRTLVAVAEAKLQVMAEQLPLVQMT
ncbi:hypothetical protein D3C79_725560 [compost metagenome]